MKKYSVPYECYFGGLQTGPITTDRFCFPRSVQLVKEPIAQLISKFNVHNRRIVSIGSSTAYEEYWMWRAGNELVLLDLDDGDTIERYLRTLPPGDGNCLDYYIGDAFTFDSADKFDVLYLSSFTPDEGRRRAIQANRFKTSIGRTAYRIGRKLGLPAPKWPADVPPYMDEVMKFSGHNLSAGGLFICQSYAGCIDVKRNPHAIELTRKQLEAHGLQLIKMYCNEKMRASLTIGFKGTSSEAINYMKSIASNPEVTKIHGRKAIDFDISRMKASVAYSLV